MSRSVVIHGHFYQPPREDPWLEEVGVEPSAAPFHDWNQRIERECYRAVAAARVPGRNGRIARIVNTLEWISFNFGPTLLEWLERHAPPTYAAIIEADRLSRVRTGGYGNAIAMPYHHAILPLSTRRDKITEVRWGITDFRRRFGRDPVGMWLPESAVDHETLEVLAAQGIAFTVLAPTQVTHPPAAGLPGRYLTAGGRSIALFLYDGELSRDLAFGPLLRDADVWAERMVARGPRHIGPHLVSLASDGETYGHHHRFGEMALAAVIEDLSGREGVLVENFASFLARHAPRDDVTLVSPSSWSCAHGVGRWRENCGCRIAPHLATQQEWRRPLREAIDWLAAEFHAVFEREATPLFRDPWAVRDEYGVVVGVGGPALTRFVPERLAGHDPDSATVVRARELLELQRNALRMFTSCGWFFDDIAGIEPLQVLRYAARGIELTGGDAPRLAAGMAERLAPAESNDPAAGNGRDLYQRQVVPRVPAWIRVAAGYAAIRHLDAGDARLTAEGYAIGEQEGQLLVTHRRTGRTFVCHATIDRPRPARIDVTVVPVGGEPAVRVGLEDLPERTRSVVRRVLTRTVAERWFEPEERIELASLEGSLSEVAARALTRAVAMLSNDRGVMAINRVTDIADLLELVGRSIPFDAQTEFWRVRSQLGSADAMALTEVGQRLGFVE